MTVVSLVWAVVAIVATLLGGFSVLARILWNTSAKWTTAALNISALTVQLAEVVKSKETDHSAINARVDRIEGRVYNHENWHAQRGRFQI